METNEKDLTKGQGIATEVIGEIAGIGAGALIGGLALAAVQASPMGKLMKAICYIGSIGITWTVQDSVAKGTKDTLGDIFEGVNSLKGLLGGQNNVESDNNTVKVEVK